MFFSLCYTTAKIGFAEAGKQIVYTASAIVTKFERTNYMPALVSTVNIKICVVLES